MSEEKEKRVLTEEEVEKMVEMVGQIQLDATSVAIQAMCFDVGHLCGLVKHPDISQMMRVKTLHMARLVSAWANSADIGNDDVTNLCNEFIEIEARFYGDILGDYSEPQECCSPVNSYPETGEVDGEAEAGE